MDTDVQQQPTGSLDRGQTRGPPRRSKSTRLKHPSLPPMKKSGSLEDVYTGTLVKELPADFPVHLDPKAIHNQIMDIDRVLGQNGMSDSLRRSLEGQVTPSRRAIRRMSAKKRNQVTASPDNEEEGTDLGVKSKGGVAGQQAVDVSITLEGEDGTVTTCKSPTDFPESINPISGALGTKTSVLRDSSISTDSGIGYELHVTREMVHTTHGVSTENSPTETGTSDRLLPPLSSMRPSLADKHLSERPDSMLSQLCVVTVSLPASIHEGQKGRGAILKFRFSPHTQIETLRVAILKVSGFAKQQLHAVLCNVLTC